MFENLLNQFSILLSPSTCLGAFLISFISGILVSFFCGVKYGNYNNKKNTINSKNNQGIIIQDQNNGK